MRSLNEPFVSIIVPIYNAINVIDECLNSVFNVDYKNFEVIIVDDCSRDKSVEFIQKDYPKAKIVRTKRRHGFAGTVNVGIKNSSGDIVVLLNMDTIVDKGWLKPLVNALIKDESIGLVGSKILSYNRKTLQHAGGLLLENGLSVHIGRGELDIGQYNYPRRVDYLCGASLGFRRSLLEKVDFFDEGYKPLYYEDTDMACKVKRHGLKVVYVPDSVLVHKENVSTNGLSKNFYYCYHKSRLRFVFKNHSLKYIADHFFPKEKKWFLNGLPKDVRTTLLKVYLVSLPSILALLIKRLIWIKIKKQPLIK